VGSLYRNKSKSSKYRRTMKSCLIDPRDANHEADAPTYRVYFWADDASGKEEWELSETDLDAVLQWIPLHSKGRSHSLWAAMKEVDGVTLVRLRGIDLDAAPETWAEQEYR
jgi:hypothetical protein